VITGLRGGSTHEAHIALKMNANSVYQKQNVMIMGGGENGMEVARSQPRPQDIKAYRSKKDWFNA
jgi:hypothetical protein